jgi:hypothetical protein
MSQGDASRSLLRWTPSGAFVLDPSARERTEGDPAIEAFARAFAEDPRGALLSLAGRAYDRSLPAPLPWLRALACRFVTGLCAVTDLESLRGAARPALDEGARSAWLREVPAFDGAEYASDARAEQQWADLGHAYEAAVAGRSETVTAWLRGLDPRFHPVGRVCFHLAERRGDEQAPFAFLATFTTGVGAAGRAQHAPLGRAVAEAASARDTAALDALLEPVERAADASPVVRDLLASRALFQPLAWSAAEAHAFLREASRCEAAGVSVRLPDWWRRAPRPTVRVSVGDAGPSRLDRDALLTWSMDVCLEGEALSEEEIAAIRACGDGLVRLRGQWVEVESERIASLLARWKEALAHARDGLTLHAALRLVAGTGEALGPTGAPDDGAAGGPWLRVEPGRWLAERLTLLRAPGGLWDDGAVDPLLCATLRPYQREGARWLSFLTELGLGGVLADDMGLGKTLQLIAWMTREKSRRAKRARVHSHLLVVPASLLSNWRDELARFAPSLGVKLAHPSARGDLCPSDEAAIDRWRRGVDVVLTSYGALARSEGLRALPWSLVALDEAQNIKNASTRQARAVKSLRSTARVALTGTPVENRLGDLWSLFDFVQPGLLGTEQSFARYARALSSSGRSDAYGPLRSLVGPYILRRTKSDRSVVADLPDKCEVEVRCGLTRTQTALYARVVADLERALGPNANPMSRRGAVLAGLSALKQVCNHPSQWTGDGAYAPAESGKFARLEEILEECGRRGEKVLIFTQFRELCEPLSSFAAGVLGAPGVTLHGGTAVRTRGSRVEAFQQDPAVSHMVLSIKAGGTGLNLTAAQHVIHFDRWWNPAVEDQATDRAYRIGQRRNVMVHKFVCRGTVEERVAAMLTDKRRLAASVVSDTSDDALRLTEMDDSSLMKLVALDLDAAVEDD